MNITNELKEAIESYKAGDKGAFDTIYSESNKYIHTCIANTMNSENRNEDMISDIMQDTYLEISESLGSLEKPESFLFWAGTIAKRKTYKALKANDQYVLLGEGESFENLPDDNNTIPEEIVLDKEKQIQVRGVINTELTEDEKDCVVGYYYNNMKQKDIAEELDIPENTVKSNIYRAKSKMRKALEGVLAVALVASIALLFVNSSLIRSAINNKKKEEPTTKQEQPTTTRQERPTSLGDDWEDEVGPTEEPTETPTEKPTEPPIEEPTEELTVVEPPEVFEAPKVSGNTVEAVGPAYEGAASKEIVWKQRNNGDVGENIYAYIYDADGKILGYEVYDADGIIEEWTKYEYVCDEKGNAIEGWENTVKADGSLSTNPTKIFEWEYYANGNIKNKKEGVWTYKYSEEGKLLKVIRDAEVIEEYEYYDNGNIKRSNIKEIYGNRHLDEGYYIYEYAEDGKLLRILNKENMEVIEAYEYYDNGNVKRMSNEDDVYEYAEDGKALRVLDRDTLEVRATYEYDGWDVKEKAVNGSLGGGVLYEYHKNGKEKRVIEFYDGEMSIVSEWDENGNTVFSGVIGESIMRVEYDAEGRRTKAYSWGNLSKYTYVDITEDTQNAKKPLSNEGVALRVTEVIRDYGFRASGWKVRKYDAEGKEIGVEKYTEEGDLLGWSERIYEYDKKGNVVEERIKMYDAHGNLINELVMASYTYKYDSKGNIKTKHCIENEITSTYEYDSNGYVIAFGEKMCASALRSFAYKNDSQGRIIEETFSVDGSLYSTTTCEYDSEGRVLEKREKIVSGGVFTETYKYDSEGRILEKREKFASGRVSTETYTYNSEGKIVEKYDYNGDEDRVEICKYDSEDRLIEESCTTNGITQYARTYEYNGDIVITRNEQYDFDGDFMGTNTYAELAEEKYDEEGNLVRGEGLEGYIYYFYEKLQ